MIYLDQRAKWRGFDLELFDHLFQHVKVNNEHHVRLMEDSEISPNASFFSRPLSDDAWSRSHYFAEMLEDFGNTDLVFFDPDNGFEIRSKRPGRKGSNKYLYREEMFRTYSAGHSVFVYQHFVRENRESFIERIADKIRARPGIADLYSLRTPNVVFFLASQALHAEHFRRQVERVATAWGDQIRVLKHPS